MLKPSDIVWIESMKTSGLLLHFALDIEDAKEKCVVLLEGERSVIVDPSDLSLLKTLPEWLKEYLERNDNRA